MPVIMRHVRLAVARPLRRHAMSIVEVYQTVATRIMQSKGITQAVRPFRRRLDPFELKFQPIALFEVMDTTIERQQCVLVRNDNPLIIS